MQAAMLNLTNNKITQLSKVAMLIWNHNCI